MDITKYKTFPPGAVYRKKADYPYSEPSDEHDDLESSKEPGHRSSSESSDAGTSHRKSGSSKLTIMDSAKNEMLRQKQMKRPKSPSSDSSRDASDQEENFAGPDLDSSVSSSDDDVTIQERLENSSRTRHSANGIVRTFRGRTLIKIEYNKKPKKFELKHHPEHNYSKKTLTPASYIEP